MDAKTTRTFRIEYAGWTASDWVTVEAPDRETAIINGLAQLPYIGAKVLNVEEVH